MEQNDFEIPELPPTPKPQRKRFVTKPAGTPAISDNLEYEQNKCTPNARKICSTTEEVLINVWGDKHYFDRHHQGDENGKRDGIDPATIEDFIRRCVKHMFLYASVCRGFKFVNYTGQSESNVRIVLQEPYNGTVLNVVTETHFLEINKYEITVTTAQCRDDFRIQLGQYVIELQGDSSSLLKRENRIDNTDLEPVCSF